jgi:long-chain acyl-CoA synthetase
MNLADNLVRSAGDTPNALALRFGDGGTMTYAELEEASRRAAALLYELGVKAGDRVAMMLPNVPHFAVLYYGTLRIGAVVVPMNPLLKEREVAYHLRDSGARTLFTWSGMHGEADKAVETIRAAEVAGYVDTEETVAGPIAAPTTIVGPTDLAAALSAVAPVDGMADLLSSDTAVILYTSGTTGQPKGAELTHGNLIDNVDIMVQDLMQLVADDVIFGGLPLFHVFGQTAGMNASVRAGACLTLLPRFEPATAMGILVEHQVTVFQGVPTMYVSMLQHLDPDAVFVSGLRMAVAGGSAMPLQVMSGFEEGFGCVVLEGYGLSETSPVASFNLPGHRKPGSIGQPVRGVQFRIVNEQGENLPPGEPGEILISGPNVMKGYWRKPEATQAAIVDGWFHTGDIGIHDDEGFYYIVDRKKDLIIRGGYNIYPREVEEVLYEHPAVAEAAVVGFSHPVHGEEVAAVVTLRPGASTTADDIQNFVRDRVAAYKYPRHIEVVNELPKNATGKILKREIKLSGTT